MKQSMPSETVMISILRDDEIYGPFGMDLIHAMLEEGRITPSDLAKEDGGKWKPLEVFLREPAIHAPPPVCQAERRAVVREWQPYLNSPLPGQRNMAPYLAASFPSGRKPFKTRVGDFFGFLLLGALLLLVPLIGWILGPLVMLGAFVQLFDSRPAPKTFEENCTRMIGDFHRDGYRDGFLLFLGIISILLGGAALAAVFFGEPSASCTQGFLISSFICFVLGGGWIRHYLVPKHLR